MTGLPHMLMALACLPLAYLGTGWLCAKAAKLGLVQAPNHRSSHTMPTPRGGGLAVALAAALYGIWIVPTTAAAGWIVLLTLAFAVLGLADDLRDLSASLRFAIQALLAALFLAVHPDLPAVIFGPVAIDGWLLSGLLLFILLWWINLFNFMDGIDGMAGCQAVFMFVAGAALSAAAMQDGLWWWFVAAALATAGFLAWNLPPARIFMGDSGSNAIAFLIAALALASIAAGWMGYAEWAVLASLFVADATVTLLRRMANGERWFRAAQAACLPASRPPARPSCGDSRLCGRESGIRSADGLCGRQDRQSVGGCRANLPAVGGTGVSPRCRET